MFSSVQTRLSEVPEVAAVAMLYVCAGQRSEQNAVDIGDRMVYGETLLMRAHPLHLLLGLSGYTHGRGRGPVMS